MNPRHIHRLERSLLCCALAGCMLVTTPAFAQSTSASLRGQVMVDSAPAADARVTATNLASGLTRSVDAANGRYSLAGLPPGTYRIDVEAAGRADSRTVTLAVGQVATLDLGVGGVAESAPVGDATDMSAVVVTGETMTETRTSEVATYVSQRQIEALPQGTRNFLAFADTVPGMQFIQDASGNTRLRSGAQSANAVNVFIDGVGQKNYVTTGGVSGQDTSRGNPFPQSAVGEYKVITQNYKAEFDQLSSAAVVAVTRSGSNEFEGSFFLDHTRTEWRSRSTFEENGAPKAESEETQYGATFGGPIVRDVAHFFIAYEAKEYQSPRTLEFGRGFLPGELPPEFREQYGTGTITAPFKEDLWFAKVDLQVGDAHLFELSTKYREESETIQVGGQRLPPAATDNTNEETRVDLRWQFSSGDWLNDAHLGYEESYWSPQPALFAPGYILSDGNWWETIGHTGGGDNYQDKGQEGWSLQNDLTYMGWAGHTVKMGFKYKSIDLHTLEQNKFNPQFYYDIHESLVVPTHVEFGAPVAGLGDGTVDSANSQFGIYIQDDWEVNAHLTLNMGVRWDVEETPSYEDFVTPTDVVAALEASNANLPGSSVDIGDFISTGSNRGRDDDNIAPRLGFSYDINGDQRHVVFGGVGRSYDRNLFDYLQNEVSKGSWGQYVYNFNTPLHPCDTVSDATCREWDPAYLDPAVLRASAVAGGAREVFLNHNDLEVPYSDQLSVGMRNAFDMFGHDWIAEVTLSHIRSRDGIAFMLGNRLDDGGFFPSDPPGATDPPPWGAGFAPFSNMILTVNALETDSNALFLRLAKSYTPSSGWGATVAYTYTDSEQNSPMDGWPGAFNAERIEDYGDFPGKVPDHRLVATGILDGPWDLTFSGKLTLASATPRYYQNCNMPEWAYCHFSFYTPDEDFKQFDFAVEKRWDTGTDLQLRLRADVLNVFNWDNYSGYDDWRGGAGEPQNPNWGRPNAISLPTRTFKVSIGFNW
ncbi:TonB-dependent receptor domain-containing protein [Luteimonas terricola]|uniref:Membrane protein n=1 Tax=Luteimonas terricola TaxID=645597 RepID=A0ABQ2EB76_9GAMM|nr:TonB-dependent receptor [Luteimonas terricola]GGK04673.1 membrane protein [Luteimonas terricola]